MRHASVDSQFQPLPLDTAMICIDRLTALAGLLAAEDVASVFAGLSAHEQAAIFGTFEAGLAEARVALIRAVKEGH
jgi:hypothetical protein